MVHIGANGAHWCKLVQMAEIGASGANSGANGANGGANGAN